MVVRFTPTPDGEPVDRERLAPVSYLPGARPSDAAAEALRQVEAVRRDGLRRDGSGPRAARQGGPVQNGSVQKGSVQNGSVQNGSVQAAPGSTRAVSRAANVSMHQLARRGMSRWELQQVLDKRGVDDATATAELDRLQAVGLLDDAALALTLVYTQHTRKGLGRSAIGHELRRRHIDQDIIDDALSEIEDDDELERALELAHKRAAQLHGLDEQTARRRLSGYLARKGYGSDVLRAAMASVFDGVDPLGGDD